MKITISKIVEISRIEQWYNVAPPKGESLQWKPGRSAQEMARFALSNQFPKFIDSVLTEYGIKETSFNCEPEAETPFEKGMGTGGPRNHDLLMIGKNTVIGIEAKVSETFDKQIKDKRNGASENMKRRLNTCLDFIYKDRPTNEDDLYYQLFSATIGTVIEAKRHGFKNAIALFIVFVGDVAKEAYYDEHVKTNNEAFAAFCKTLGLEERGGRLPELPGAPGVNVWIRKVEVNIGNYQF